MKSAIVAYASGWYRAYVPLFEFFAEKSYPGVDIEVRVLHPVRVPYEAACMRFLDGWSYDEVYVTDIDMMLHPGLFEAHRAWVKEYNGCYSNSLRGKNEPNGLQRMTGLHYATQEWYCETMSQRFFYRERIRRRHFGFARFCDETMLRDICLTAGLPLFPRRKPLSYWHFGVHLGTLRCYESHTRQTKNTQLDLRISPRRAQWWVENTEGSKQYEKIRHHLRVSCPRIFAQLEYFDAYARRRSAAAR